MNDEYNRNFNCGLELAKNGQFAASLAFFEKAASISRDPGLLQNWSISLKNMGQFDQSLALALEAEEKIPQTDSANKAKISFNIANTYRDKEENRKSIEWFSKSVEWNLFLDGPRINLAEVLIEIGEYDQAIQQLEFHIRQIDNNDESVKQLLGLAKGCKEQGESYLDDFTGGGELVYKWRNQKCREAYDKALDLAERILNAKTSKDTLFIQLKAELDLILDLEEDNNFPFFWILACHWYAEMSLLKSELPFFSEEIQEDELYLADLASRCGQRARNLLHNVDIDQSNRFDFSLLFSGLAVAFMKLGKKDKALHHCNLGLELEPKSNRLRNIIKALEK